jgi:hypothetical protein
MDMSRTALARRVQSFQQKAAANGGLVRDGMEQAAEAGVAYALGRAEGMGVTDTASHGTSMAVVAAGLTGEFFAPNGAVKILARGARRAGVTVLSYKAGLKSGLESGAKA